MATGKQVRGFSVPCPNCTDIPGMSVYLNDLDRFKCSNCEEEFSREFIQSLVAGWGRVLEWIDCYDKAHTFKPPGVADDEIDGFTDRSRRHGA